MNDKAFLPMVCDLPDPQTDETYAKVAVAVACYAARNGGVDLALELGATLGLPWHAYVMAKTMLMEESCR